MITKPVQMCSFHFKEFRLNQSCGGSCQGGGGAVSRDSSDVGGGGQLNTLMYATKNAVYEIVCTQKKA